MYTVQQITGLICNLNLRESRKMTTFSRRLVLGPMWVTKMRTISSQEIRKQHQSKKSIFLAAWPVYLLITFQAERTMTMTMTAMVWKDFSGSIAPLIVGSTQQGTTYTLWSLLQIPFSIGFSSGIILSSHNCVRGIHATHLLHLLLNSPFQWRSNLP